MILYSTTHYSQLVVDNSLFNNSSFVICHSKTRRSTTSYSTTHHDESYQETQ